MKIEINNLVRAKVSYSHIRKIEQIFSRKFHLKNERISLVIVNDAKMKKLNRTYRGKNSTTDVLSFDTGFSKFFPTEGEWFLGEIIISYPQVKRQALENKKSVQEEFFTVLAHGILHLLGYDHGNKQEERRMFKLQEFVVAGL